MEALERVGGWLRTGVSTNDGACNGWVRRNTRRPSPDGDYLCNNSNEGKLDEINVVIFGMGFSIRGVVEGTWGYVGLICGGLVLGNIWPFGPSSVFVLVLIFIWGMDILHAIFPIKHLISSFTEP